MKANKYKEIETTMPTGYCPVCLKTEGCTCFEDYSKNMETDEQMKVKEKDIILELYGLIKEQEIISPDEEHLINIILNKYEIRRKI